MSLGYFLCTGYTNVQFDAFISAPGAILSTPEIIQEELLTPGVDGRRFRTVHRNTKQFTATTYHNVATYDAGITLLGNLSLLNGQNVGINLTAGGSTIWFTETNLAGTLHVVDVSIELRPNGLTGAGITTGTHHVVAMWTLVLMTYVNTNASP